MEYTKALLLVRGHGLGSPGFQLFLAVDNAPPPA